MGNDEFYPKLSQAISLCFAANAMLAFIFLLMMLIDHYFGMVNSIGDPSAQLLSFSLVLRWAYKKTNQTDERVFPFTWFSPGIIFPLIMLLVGTSIITSEVDNILRYFLPMPSFLFEIEDNLFTSRLGAITLCIIVAPITEELLIRGIILRSFLRHYNPLKAIVISALLFGFFHLNPYQFFSAFVGGLILGWVYFKIGSLWPCIIAHAFFNSIDFIFSGIPGYTTEISPDTRVVFQPIWVDVLGIICVIAGILILSKFFSNDGILAEKRKNHRQVLIMDRVL